MKRLTGILAALIFTVGLLGQSDGDWRTRSSGDWTNNDVWQYYKGSQSTWRDTTGFPENLFTTAVNLSDGDTLTCSSIIRAGSGGQLIIDDGAQLTTSAIINGAVGGKAPYIEINGTLITSNAVLSETFNVTSTGTFNTSYNGAFGWWVSTIQPSTATLDGTVHYSRNGGQIIGCLTADQQYNNLIISGSGEKVPSNSIVINGTLNIQSGGTFEMDGKSVTIDGTSIVNNGTFQDTYVTIGGSIKFQGSTISITGSGTFPLEFYGIDVGETFVSTCDLTISSSNLIQVKYLSIDGSVTLGSSAKLSVSEGCESWGFVETFAIESNSGSTGSLILSSFTNNFGAGSSIIRYIPTLNRWHLVSSPLPGQSISSFLSANSAIPTNGSERAMTDFNPGVGWNSYFTSGTSGSLSAGKGFLTRISSGSNLTFTGDPVTSNQAVSLTTSASNCIGNPFTSSLYLGNGSGGFIFDNASAFDPSYVTVYVWNEQSGYSGKNNNDYNAITYSDNAYVQPGQAFIVFTSSSGSSMTFNTSRQAHNNPAFYKKSAEAETPTLCLQAENESSVSNTKFQFINGMTHGLDPGYDAGLFGANDELSLYSQLIEDNGVDFMVQALPDEGFREMEVPLGLVCGTAGLVTFSISEQVNLPDGAGAVLEDREMDVFTDLTKGNYVVNLESACSGVGRFFLHPYDPEYEETGILQDHFELATFAHNNEIHIQGNIVDHTSVYLADLSGRMIRTWQIEAGTHHVLNAGNIEKGIYILMVSGGGNQVSEKIRID